MLSNQPFLPAKAAVLSQLPHQTQRLHLRERGLIHSFPSNVKGKGRRGPCKQAERNTRSGFPKDLQVWGMALSCDLLNQGKPSGRAVLTGIVSGWRLTGNFANSLNESSP